MQTDFFTRHKRAMLFFSSGKDSAACLKLLQPYWGQFDVVWCNMGNPYPEVVEYMARIKETVPRFVEVNGKQKEFIAKWGYPVDAVPISALPLKKRFIPYTSCCGANFWTVMMRYILANEITGIIKGQKLADRLRSELNSGALVDGKEIWHPLETWTDRDVVQFLGDDLPASYKRGNTSSLDCMNCTAYLPENWNRLSELKIISPETYLEVSSVLSVWKSAVAPALEVVNACS